MDSRVCICRKVVKSEVAADRGPPEVSELHVPRCSEPRGCLPTIGEEDLKRTEVPSLATTSLHPACFAWGVVTLNTDVFRRWQPQGTRIKAA